MVILGLVAMKPDSTSRELSRGPRSGRDAASRRLGLGHAGLNAQRGRGLHGRDCRGPQVDAGLGHAEFRRGRGSSGDAGSRRRGLRDARLNAQRGRGLHGRGGTDNDARLCVSDRGGGCVHGDRGVVLGFRSYAAGDQRADRDARAHQGDTEEAGDPLHDWSL